MTTTTNICQLCKYSVQQPGFANMPGVRYCRRNPPFATPVLDEVNRKLLGVCTSWPRVDDADWCGEFTRRCDFETKMFLKMELEKALKELNDAKP
jgi:hypothetical protein